MKLNHKSGTDHEYPWRSSSFHVLSICRKIKSWNSEQTLEEPKQMIPIIQRCMRVGRTTFIPTHARFPIASCDSSRSFYELSTRQVHESLEWNAMNLEYVDIPKTQQQQTHMTIRMTIERMKGSGWKQWPIDEIISWSMVSKWIRPVSSFVWKRDQL